MKDVNDAEHLRHDPTMRWLVGGNAAQVVWLQANQDRCEGRVSRPLSCLPVGRCRHPKEKCCKILGSLRNDGRSHHQRQASKSNPRAERVPMPKKKGPISLSITTRMACNTSSHPPPIRASGQSRNSLLFMSSSVRGIPVKASDQHLIHS
jgi:hypothetical protein